MILFPVAFFVSRTSCLPFSIATVLFKSKMSENPHKDLNLATYISAGLTIVSGLALSKLLFGGFSDLSAVNFSRGWVSPWIAATIGVAAGVIIGAIAEYYTSSDYKPTQNLAHTSLEGPALTITQGMAVGMKSCMAPCVVLGAGIIISYYVSGMFGVAMAVMLSSHQYL